MLSLLTYTAVAYTDRGILKLDNTCAARRLHADHAGSARRRRLRIPSPPDRPARPLLCFSVRSTFDRLVDGSRHIFVRFDKEYSYGDEHDAWKDFAKTVGESSADVLIADVGVSGAALRPRPWRAASATRAAAHIAEARHPAAPQSTATRTTPTSPTVTPSRATISRRSGSGPRAPRTALSRSSFRETKRRTTSCASSRRRRAPGSDWRGRSRRSMCSPRSSWGERTATSVAPPCVRRRLPGCSACRAWRPACDGGARAHPARPAPGMSAHWAAV